MVSITNSLIFWIYNPMALQLLAIKKIRYSLSLVELAVKILASFYICIDYDTT